jgi:hypothetical protein
VRPHGVRLLSRRGRWRPADVAAMAEKAARRWIRLPGS